MRVLHVTISMDASWGGPSAFVAGLASAQAKLGAEVTVASSAPAGSSPREVVFCGRDVAVDIFPQGRFSRFWTGFSRPYARFIASQAAQHDVIHAHELWHYPLYMASRESRKRGIPLVITPHGCLAPLALSNDRLLKGIYSPLVQRPILNSASLVHVLTGQEEQDTRSYGVSSPTTVIPAGVEIGPSHGSSEASTGTAPPDGKEPFQVLFLGRIIPNKGAGLLIDAVASLREKGHNVRLTMAGPCSPEYRSHLQDRIESLDAKSAICFPGFVTGSEKDMVFAGADLFVLPSYSEGFSIAVLEAMAHSLPVVLSPQCNFPEAAQAGAALEVEPAVDPLTDALESLLENPEEARQMARRGRALVEEQYSWETIAAQFLEAYRKLTV